MADPRIAVQIAAVDKFTANLDKFRKDLDRSGGAVSTLNRRMGGIELPSLDVRAITRQADQVRQHVQSRLSGITSLVGSAVPELGVLAGVGTVAGLAQLVEQYAGFGVALKNTSVIAGTTAQGMDSLRGAARMVGLSADTADAAMTGLNKTVADAWFGKAPQAAALFRQWGIGLQGIGGGAKRAEDVLPQVADHIREIAKVDPRAAVTALGALGLSADALPVLMRGADGLAQLRQEAARLAGITDDNQHSAERFTESMGRMGIAADRVGRSIMTAVEPHLTPMLSSLSEYVDKHGDDIGQGFDHLGSALEKVDWKKAGTGIEAVGSLALNAGPRLLKFGQDFESIIDKIRAARQAVGADAVGKFFNPDLDTTATERMRAGLAGEPGGPGDGDDFRQGVYEKLSPSSQEAYRSSRQVRAQYNHYPSLQSVGTSGAAVNQSAEAKQAYDFWVGKGLTPAGASAMVATEQVEAAGLGNAGARGDGGEAHGLFQHHADRRAAIFRATGIDMSSASAAQQREGLYQEMVRGLDPQAASALSILQNTTDPRYAAAVATQRIERPADTVGESMRRGAIAAAWMARLGKAQAGAAATADPEVPDLTRGGRVAASETGETPDLTRGGRLPQVLAATAAPPRPAATDNDGNSTVRVEIEHLNVPDGVSMRASTQGTGAEIGAIRTRQAMPNAGDAMYNARRDY